MPIYEYQCGSCGEITEVLQKMSEKPLRKCSSCGGKLSKLMSMNTFHLKGSGWYVTDYAGKKQPPTESKAKSDSGSDGSKVDSTKSSTKDSTAGAAKKTSD